MSDTGEGISFIGHMLPREGKFFCYTDTYGANYAINENKIFYLKEEPIESNTLEMFEMLRKEETLKTKNNA